MGHYEPENPSVDDHWLKLASMAFAHAAANKTGGAPGTEGTVRTALLSAVDTLRTHERVDASFVDEIVERVEQLGPSLVGAQGFDRQRLARWFEVSPEQFDRLPLDRLDSDVLFSHVHYENLFREWFADWGYVVTQGEELEGPYGTDFVPDVHATLDTLHGHFQVAISLFCADPPDEMRVRGMLDIVQAFAPHGSEFGERDVLLLVTPHKFPEGASEGIRQHARQDAYWIVEVEAHDLDLLENAGSVAARKERLCDLVSSAARLTMPMVA